MYVSMVKSFVPIIMSPRLVSSALVGGNASSPLTAFDSSIANADTKDDSPDGNVNRAVSVYVFVPTLY